MEYPGSIFTRAWRRTVLSLFIILFSIITPLLVLYTIGYRYDSKYGILMETGALSIEALPKNAVVYVNNQNVGEKLPIRLSALSPEMYTVRISQSGYYDWQKEVEVRNQVTTYIKDIQLIKKSTPELMVTGTIQNVSLSPSGNFLLYTQMIGTKNKLFLLNTLTNKIIKSQDIPTASFSPALWSKDQNFVILADTATPYHTLQIIPVDPLMSSYNLARLNTDAITKIAWRGTVNPELYYETHDKDLYSFNPATKVAIFLKNAQDILDWTVHDDQMWALGVVTSSAHLELIQDFLITPQITILDQSELTKLPLTDWHMEAAQGTTVALRHGTDQTVFLIHDHQLYSLPVTRFIISPFQDWWLLWSNFELWSYSEGESPHLITRSGEELRSVVPLDQFNTLLLAWQNKNSILFPYYFVMHDFNSSPFKDSAADPYRRILYFTGTTDTTEGLWQVHY